MVEVIQGIKPGDYLHVILGLYSISQGGLGCARTMRNLWSALPDDAEYPFRLTFGSAKWKPSLPNLSLYPPCQMLSPPPLDLAADGRVFVVQVTPDYPVTVRPLSANRLIARGRSGGGRHVV